MGNIPFLFCFSIRNVKDPVPFVGFPLGNEQEAVFCLFPIGSEEDPFCFFVFQKEFRKIHVFLIVFQ